MTLRSYSVLDMLLPLIIISQVQNQSWRLFLIVTNFGHFLLFCYQSWQFYSFLFGKIGMLSPMFTAKEYVIQEYLFHMMAYVLSGKNFWVIEKCVIQVNATKLSNQKHLPNMVAFNLDNTFFYDPKIFTQENICHHVEQMILSDIFFG